MEFIVFGKDIVVEKKKGLLAKEQLGEYKLDEKKIVIDSTLKGEELIYTYLHELIHATADRLGWHNTSLTHDFEEILADNIPRMILENFEVKCKKIKGA